jgi:hypothetical protein
LYGNGTIELIGELGDDFVIKCFSQELSATAAVLFPNCLPQVSWFAGGVFQMLVPDEAIVELLRARFEGREAIYVEKGALRVRVSDIRGDTAQKLYISAEVEEIPTAGFPAGVFYETRRSEPSPLRWSIGAGYLTRFSDHTWNMGYGGWSLFFAPRIIDGVVGLALRFPEDLDPFQRYKEILNYLQDQEAYEPSRPLFAKG